MARVAVLGLGAMGSRMAANLLDSGHAVNVWNRTPNRTEVLEKAGAVASATPAAAARTADFVISIVRDDEASRAVWLDPNTGALAGMPRSALAIESSTLTVDWVQNLARHFEDAGVAFIDAPVAGSRPQAEARQLIYLVGGSEGSVERAKPILEVLGGALHHAGPVGSGAAVKLMVNALLAIQGATMAELIGFAHKVGLDETRAIDIVSSTPVCSPAAGVLAGAMLAEKFDPLFPIELVEKDLSYIVHAAQSAGTDVPVSAAAREVFGAAIRNGYGDLNITAVAKNRGS